MKKSIVILVSLFFVTTALLAQKKPASPRITAEAENVSVAYGQPSKKGREIFGKLVPFDKVWRTGANEATEITFKKDVNFGGKDVKAGTYALFTIPGAKEWKVILNSKLGEWGSYGYDKIKDKDVASVSVKAKNLDSEVESLTISVEGSAVTISWDKTSVSVPLKF